MHKPEEKSDSYHMICGTDVTIFKPVVCSQVIYRMAEKFGRELDFTDWELNKPAAKLNSAKFLAKISNRFPKHLSTLCSSAHKGPLPHRDASSRLGVHVLLSSYSIVSCQLHLQRFHTSCSTANGLDSVPTHVGYVCLYACA